ncbi:MAG: CPBP family glutamic-type intramembrane protease [Sulfolobales archaeon]|nr:CPBP family glutamic-type intramembrane protease [Sulfolobales archaeon]MDW7969970.1 CPBP family glutamic-type intramembrane protease [Sulfolobales archaeon]
MNEGINARRNSLLTISLFTALLFVTTLTLDFIMLKHSYESRDSQLYQSLLTLRNFIPLFSVVTAVKILRRDVRHSLRDYGLRRCKFRLLLLSGLMPYLMYGLGTAYAFIAGFEVLNPLIPLYRDYGANLPEGSEAFLLTMSLMSTLFVGTTILCLIMLGQEVGWRGLLLNELTTLLKNNLLTNLVIGVIWGLWYSPLIILYGIYYPDHRDILGISMMIIACYSLSLLFSHIKLRIGSLLAPAAASGVLNGLHNLMAYTAVVNDSLYSMPIGLLGISSIITLTILLNILWR